jgi:hypothetical protein
MISFDVRVLTDDGSGPQRLYQLSPAPAPGWSGFLESALRAKSLEAAGLDPSLKIEQVGSDLRVSKVTPESSIATDRFVTAAVAAASARAYREHGGRSSR